VHTIDLSSSDTDEALKLLPLSPARGYQSPLLKPRSSSDSELFEDWPEANDMVASVYIALTTHALSSRASTVDSMCGGQKSRAGIVCSAIMFAGSFINETSVAENYADHHSAEKI
jgi:hypothetical protein